MAGNRTAAIILVASTATLEDVVLRDTLADATGRFGGGIGLQLNPATGTTSEVSVRRSLVAGNREAGLSVIGDRPPPYSSMLTWIEAVGSTSGATSSGVPSSV